jgi:sulfite reductase (NADPH) flavoprotein alpha-component
MSSALEAVTPLLAANDRDALRTLVADYDREQLLWSSGYLAGLAAAAGAPAADATPVAEPDPWHIFFATETGNSRRIAESLAASARDAGLAVKLLDLRETRPKFLTRINRALFIVATHGVGDAPDGSESFFEFWFGDNAPSLQELQYSVLALGDSSYADFCAIGQRLDERLQALGATALTPRVDCDLDYDTPAAAWTKAVLDKASADRPAAATARLRAVASKPRYSRDNPYDADVLAVQAITGKDSSKAVHHIEIDIENAGLQYLPGDALGVVATNPPPLVAATLAATGLDGDTQVTLGEQSLPLAEALESRKEITVLSRPLLSYLGERHPELQSVLADRDELGRWFKTRQLIDAVSDYPVEWSAQAFVDQLRSLTPRLYSIASSPDANPGEVHLTVAEVRYQMYGRDHWGAASSYLAAGHSSVPVYVQANEHFRLPADGQTPVIMIGAGTGVAPYRAFVEHRREHGHTGDNWLIFGDRNFSSDFLYQLEWLRYRKDGSLKRLDVAFSRDQATKIYVQHRIRENARDIWSWLQRGAHIYVCGDADYMARDVHAALLGVLASAGGLSDERAAAELAELKAAGRYLRDVY